MSIAWEYLTPLQQSQLQATRPDLHFGVLRCQRFHDGHQCTGQVVRGECLSCGSEHDKHGNYSGHPDAVGIKQLYQHGGFHWG